MQNVIQRRLGCPSLKFVQRYPGLNQCSPGLEFRTQTLFENFSEPYFHLSIAFVGSGRQTRARKINKTTCSNHPTRLVVQNRLET